MRTMNARALPAVAMALLSLCGVAAASATEGLIVGCPLRGTGGDFLDRGFYVTNYPGNNLSEVLLAYTSSTAGFYTISLTARRGTFDGPIVGATQIATPFVPTTGELEVIFDFGGAPVTPGDTITFTQSASGPGNLAYDIGNGPLGGGGSPFCPNVFETTETSPPLDHIRRHTVGLQMGQQTKSTACIPSDTIMCIDNNPGDQRFKVTASFHTSQGGGLSGNGQEIPLAPLGVSQGGLFWFFNASNPEMLVKLINGCPLNGHFWVFLSAGTNVSFDVTVFDEHNGHTVTYHNPDLNPAFPVQDVNALTCP